MHFWLCVSRVGTDIQFFAAPESSLSVSHKSILDFSYTSTNGDKGKQAFVSFIPTLKDAPIGTPLIMGLSAHAIAAFDFLITARAALATFTPADLEKLFGSTEYVPVATQPVATDGTESVRVLYWMADVLHLNPISGPFETEQEVIAAMKEWPPHCWLNRRNADGSNSGNLISWTNGVRDDGL